MDEKTRQFVEALMFFADKTNELDKAYIEAKNELNRLFNERMEALGKRTDEGKM